MTHHSKELAIPELYMRPSQRGLFIIWLAAMNLPPDDAYRVYSRWCTDLGTRQIRSDIDSLCGAGFNIS